MKNANTNTTQIRFKKPLRKTLALLLALILCVSSLPLSAFVAHTIEVNYPDAEEVVIDLKDGYTHDLGTEIPEDALGGTWNTSDSAVLAIDGNGTVTAHKVGEATVTYTYMKWVETTVESFADVADDTVADDAAEASEDGEPAETAEAADDASETDEEAEIAEAYDIPDVAKIAEDEPTGEFQEAVIAWHVTVVDTTPMVPLSEILKDGKMYTTIYNANRDMVVDTNDPEILEGIENEEIWSYESFDGTVGLGDGLYVYFRMPEILPHQGEKGVQEGIRYYVDLPNELIPNPEDDNGNQILNPDKPLTFFQIAEGRLTARGGIYGEEGNWKLIITFSDVEDQWNISGTFQYAVTVNPDLEQGSKQRPDFGPGGKLKFTVTKEEDPPDPEKPADYSLYLNVSDTANANYTWTATVTDNTEVVPGESRFLPYTDLTLTAEDGWGFIAATYDFNVVKQSKVNVTYTDDTYEELSYYGYTTNSSHSEDIEGWFCSAGSEHNIKVSIQFWNEEAFYTDEYSYFFITNVAHIQIGELLEDYGPNVEGYAKNIKSVSITIPVDVVDDYMYGGTSKTYYANAELTSSINSNIFPKKVAYTSKTVSYGWGTPSLYESSTSPSYSYDYYPESLYTTLDTNNSSYQGNYYWFEFQPDPSNVISCNTNYYVSNASFRAGYSLESSYKTSATFNRFDLYGRFPVSDWDFIGTCSIQDLKNNYAGSFNNGGTPDLKLKYQVKKVFENCSSGDLVIYRSRYTLGHGKYAYIVIDPGNSFYSSNSNYVNNNNGWYQYPESCNVYKTNSAKAATWRIHVFNAPNTTASLQFDQMLGSFIVNDENSGGSSSDQVNIGLGSYDSSYKSYGTSGYGFSRYQSSYMSGTWVDDNTIFWQFTFDATNWPSWYTGRLYIQPGEYQDAQFDGHGGYDLPGIPNNYPGVFVKSTSGSWSQWGSGPNYYSGATNATIYQNTFDTTLKSWNGSIYYWESGYVNTGYRDSNGDITVGFFTKVNSNGSYYDELSCKAEFVVAGGDMMRTGSYYNSSSTGAQQYPFKISATGYVPNPSLSKSGTLIEHNENIDPTKTTALWTVSPSNVVGTHSSHTSSPIVSDYYGWYNGMLTVVDDMRSSSAVDLAGNYVSSNPGAFTHITKMFPNTVYFSSTSDGGSGGTIPYADPTQDSGYFGDSSWQKYVDGSWYYMGGDYLWDSDKPGIYKYTLSSWYAAPVEVYVAYAGDMVNAVSSKMMGDLVDVFGGAYVATGVASWSFSHPLVVQYRGLKNLTSIGPGVTYITEFDNEAFCASAVEYSDMSEAEQLVPVYDVTFKNAAMLSSWNMLNKSPATTELTKRVVASLYVDKSVAEIPVMDGEGNYSPRRTGKYTLNAINGTSDTAFVAVEDYLTAAKNTLDNGVGSTSYDPGSSYVFEGASVTERDKEAAKVLLSNLILGNIEIVEQAPNEKGATLIYKDGKWAKGWENSTFEINGEKGYSSDHIGSLFKAKFVKTDAEITAGTVFHITYDMTIDMNGKVTDGFRLTDFYTRYGLYIENTVCAARPYKKLSDVATLSNNLLGELDESENLLIVYADGEVGAHYLQPERLVKTEIAESIKHPNPVGSDHWEWLVYNWTGSMGPTNEISVSLRDDLHFMVQQMKVVYNGELVDLVAFAKEIDAMEDGPEKDALKEEIQLYFDQMFEIIERHLTFSNLKIYLTDYKPDSLAGNLNSGDMIWDLSDFSFTNSDAGTIEWTDNASGVSLTLTYPNAGGVEKDEKVESWLYNVFDFFGFTLKAEHLTQEQYLACTYDVDIDWNAVKREAIELFGVFNIRGNLKNEVESDSGLKDSAASGSIDVEETVFEKKLTDSNAAEGTAVWEIHAFTGGVSGNSIVINDNVAAKIPDDIAEDDEEALENAERIAAAANAATRIEDVKVTLNDELIYDNGEYLNGWTEANLTIKINQLSLTVVIRNTSGNTVLDMNQDYGVAYKTSFDKDLFIKNGGQAGDSYTLLNSASMRCGNFNRSASSTADLAPDIPIDAEKIFNGLDQYTASWTALAMTGNAERKNFTLTDRFYVTGGDSVDVQDWTYLSDILITVQTGSEEPVSYTIDELPEGVVITDVNGNELLVNEYGFNGFILVFESLPAHTTVTIDYDTTIDWESYAEATGLTQTTFVLDNYFSAASDDGYTSGTKRERTEIEASRTLEKSGDKKGADDGYPLIDWTFNINLNNYFSNEELSMIDNISIKDELSPVLQYVDDSLTISDPAGNPILDYEINTNDQTILIKDNDPQSNPKFTIDFTTKCLASVSSLTNTATLILDTNTTIAESSSRNMGKIETAGIYGTIKSNTTGAFTPTAYKYVDHELCTQEGAYTFLLTESDENGNVLTDAYSDRAENNADGKIIFNEIRYFEEGIHYYLIQELGKEPQDDRIFMIKVNVVATDDGGFITKASVVTPENYFDVRFDNTDDDKVTDFTVEKIWKDNNDAAGIRPGSITVYLYQGDEPYNNMSVTLNESNGWTYTWENLPIAGGEYSAREADVPAGYESETVTEDGVTTITNTVTQGSLTISKTVMGSEGETDRDFHFVVLLTDSKGTTLTERFNYVGSKTGSIASGEQITLKHDEYITITHLPEGTRYTVVELEANTDGYASAAINEEGKIAAGEMQKAEFINKKGEDLPGDCSLTISKTVAGKDGETRRKFEFTVTLTDKYGLPLVNEYEYIGSKSGTIRSGDTIKLKHNEYITIIGLPEGAQYSVVETEANQDGYLTAGNNVSGSVSSVTETVASFVNVKGEPGEPEGDIANIRVKKVWRDNGSDARPTKITVQLYCDGEAYLQPIVLNSSNNWSYSWTDLDKDHVWTVGELNVPEGYEATVSFEGNDWTITNTKEDTPDEPKEPEEPNEPNTPDIPKTDTDKTTSPNTGNDSAQLWAALTELGAVMAASLYIVRKKKRFN